LTALQVWVREAHRAPLPFGLKAIVRVRIVPDTRSSVMVPVTVWCSSKRMPRSRNLSTRVFLNFPSAVTSIGCR
jgi:hypothetical protein